MEVFVPKVGGELVLPWEPLTIMPIGDIQYAGPDGTADLGRLQRHITWGVEHGCHFLGMGDYVDFLSPSNRQRLKQADLYDTASLVIEQAATALEQKIMDILAPTRGRWLGLVEGHHYFVHLDGATTGQHLAEFLGCTYGGDSMLMRLTFRQKVGAGSRGLNSTLFVHHGHGSSTAPGGPLTRLVKLTAYIDAQVFFLGHYHQVMVYPFDQLTVTQRGVPKLYHTTRAIVLTGSFMRGWMQGNQIGGRPKGSYVEQGLMPPAALGGPLVTLTPRRIFQEGSEVLLVDIRGSV